MPGAIEYQYSVLRVVPDVERGERINAGVVLYAPTRAFLGARIRLNPERLATLAPQADIAAVSSRLEALARVAAGEPSGGPIARLESSGRFHWLVAPSSTIIQPSEVHTGLCDDPAAALERLFRRLVS